MVEKTGIILIFIQFSGVFRRNDYLFAVNTAEQH